MRKVFGVIAVAALTACSEGATAPAEIALSAADLAAAGIVNLSGTWKLDPARSVFPAGATGRPQEGGSGGRPHGFGRPDQAGAAQERFDGTLVITQGTNTVTINGRTIRVDGSVQGGTTAGRPGASVSATWQGNALVLTRTLPDGRTIPESLGVSDDGKTLTVSAVTPAGAVSRVFGRV